MLKTNIWHSRKYTIENSVPKNLCQLYKFQIALPHQPDQKKEIQPQSCRYQTKAIRIDKDTAKFQISDWAEVNERQELGYAVLPESPVGYFNEQEDEGFGAFQTRVNEKFYSWDCVETNQDWVQY